MIYAPSVLKRCKICGEPKLLSEFYRKTGCKDGVTPECKICRCLKDGFTPLAFREVLPEGMKRCDACKQVLPETTGHFSRNNRCHNGFLNICTACRSAERKAEYAADPHLRETARIKTRQWLADHPELARETKRAYTRSHSQEIYHRVKQWRKDNPEKFRASNLAKEHRRRARKYQAEGTHNNGDVQRQYKAQDGQCYWCSKPMGELYTVDHVIPLSRGGSDWPSNIVCACPHCNFSRGGKLPHEWPEGGKLL